MRNLQAPLLTKKEWLGIILITLAIGGIGVCIALILA